MRTGDERRAIPEKDMRCDKNKRILKHVGQSACVTIESSYSEATEYSVQFAIENWISKPLVSEPHNLLASNISAFSVAVIPLFVHVLFLFTLPSTFTHKGMPLCRKYQ